eukprot:jgi/Mesen1/9360/ME000061S08809
MAETPTTYMNGAALPPAGTVENIKSRTEASLSRIDEYCMSLDGTKPIKSVLIANNGIAAVKFIRSIRSWAYETFGVERAVLMVAMATPEDMKANAEHIRMADRFVEVPGGTNNNNYANVQLIVEVAERTGVDAVWPGWGHASENPDLPTALLERGIVFLGPPAEPMAALGDKIGSSLIAQTAKVPTLGWSGSQVVLPTDGGFENLPEDLYHKACVHTPEEALASCIAIGLPAMIKASWGGGGKGIRKVQTEEEVGPLFKQVQGEVPGSPIFIMKLASMSRHLEVQLLCDKYGNVAALHSRDCSVQRRHQKIIEEGPITVAPPETVRELEKGACRLAKMVGYVGCATVEYLYSMESGEFYFLELNPRLQVEHPVTEWIAGVNLPAAQLAVGMGIPLWRMPEVRRLFGQPAGGSLNSWRTAALHATPFDFDTAVQVKPKGHVVAVRVTSEDPDDGFKPTSGRVQELSFRSKPDVWAYFSIKSGGGIHEFSDSQFGHLFAFGENRPAAIANMVLTLKELQIRGEIRTNVDYTVDLLQSAEYKDNKIHTGWLDTRIAMRVVAERPPWHICVLGGALYTAEKIATTRVSEYVGYLEKGQIPPKHISLVSFEVPLNIDGVKYLVSMTKRAPGGYMLRVNNSRVDAEQLDGKSHVLYAEDEAVGTRLLIDGRTCLLQNDHDPSQLIAETPCKLMRYLVSDGGHVNSDEAYAEVEVMKMCMPLLAPAAGTLHHKLSEGQTMVSGDLIAGLDLDDPSAVRKAVPFTNELPPLGPPTSLGGKVHQRCAAAVIKAKNVLAGYEHNVEEVVKELLECLSNPQLPLLEWNDVTAVLATRMPKELKHQLDVTLRAYEPALRAGVAEFPATPFLNHINLATSYVDGQAGHARLVVKQLFEEYLAVEELFSQETQSDDVIEALRQKHKKDLARVVDTVLSHQGVKRKNAMIMLLLDKMVLSNSGPFRELLLRFSSLQHSSHAERERPRSDIAVCFLFPPAALCQVALKAGNIHEESNLTELRASIVRSLSDPDLAALAVDTSELSGHGGTLSAFSPNGASATLSERMESLADAPLAIEDVLATLFDHGDRTLQTRALETYIMRLYQPYLVKGSVSLKPHNGSSVLATWQFWEESPAPPAPGLTEPQQATEAARGIQRWGAMVVASTLTNIQDSVTAAINEAYGLSANKGAEVKADGPKPLRRNRTFVGTPSGLGNMLHIALAMHGDAYPAKTPSCDEAAAELRIKMLGSLVLGPKLGELLHETGVELVSCLVRRDDVSLPARHCFHWSNERSMFLEQPLLRHVEPPLSDLLELEKLKAFPTMRYARSRDRQWHMYSAVERPAGTRRLFLRALVRQPQPSSENNLFSLVPNLESPPNGGFSEKDLQALEEGGAPAAAAANLGGGSPANGGTAVAVSVAAEGLMWAMTGALEELELAAHDAGGRADHVHMFLSVLGALHLPQADYSSSGSAEGAQRSVGEVVEAIEAISLSINSRLGARMHRLAVAVWEVRLRVKDAGVGSGAWRAVVANPSGHASTVEVYREALDPVEQVPAYFSPYTPAQGALHTTPLAAPYPALHSVERRRLAARRTHTTYCYDFVLVIEEALKASWAAAVAADPSLRTPEGPLLAATELAFVKDPLDWDTQLTEVKRPMGSNNVGMVGWSIDMKSPECPGGRTVLVVANDVTFGAGSFGMREDRVFKAMTDRAVARKLPLVYLAANSGARIGVAEEVRAAFKVGWQQDDSPERGFQYLYLTPDDYARLGAASVFASEITTPGGEKRWRISDIIGADDGLGVENLSGSGAIAGAFSRAYKETFTLTYVTGRTVGIGAYLSRLGIRCIQREDQPIILTGYAALNKLLGREVYSSQMQLGGPKIMAVNGVVHSTVTNDLEGVSAILKWLAFVPAIVGGPLPVLRSQDPVDRPVQYVPDQTCDPRAACAGVAGADDTWLGGIFDEGSFIEYHAGWAQTVVIGRARLGGIPVGVVAVETQTVMQNIPADPGAPDSHERVVAQAGQVWFPDSALKTAQAMFDFNREGLPLFILANWRGFSGGQRDLFEGVLQSGALIVEHLRTYNQPVFVYIPKTGELRGGAWAVVDSKINPDMVEMYADESARGAVLEPEGIVEIKFRSRELLECMHRLDAPLAQLDRQLKAAMQMGPEEAAGDVQGLQGQIKAREKALLPVYRTIAIKFAELHDTPRRMQAKGVIKQIVPWAGSRAFFYRKLVRRLAEEGLVADVREASGGSLSRRQAMDLVKQWFAGETWSNDEAFLAWAHERHAVERHLKDLRTQRVAEQVTALALAAGGAEGLQRGLSALLSSVDAKQRKTLAQQLKDAIESTL